MPSSLFCGTSGYSYMHWSDGVFYPRGLDQRDWLSYYASRFSSVELNVSFYRLPSKKSFENWSSNTPRSYVFAVKGSRFVTHMKKLQDCGEPLAAFYGNAAGLGEKLAVTLWQLPPTFKSNVERLETFCRLLIQNDVARNCRHAFEFRHDSWFCREVYETLEKYNFALCVAHSRDRPYRKMTTADYVYLRLHGGEVLPDSNYSETELEAWAQTATSWLESGKDIYAYFNNDAHGYAISNAIRFRELIEERKSNAGQ